MAVKRPQNLVSFGCLHPLKILTKDGEEIYVPCRKCAYCRQHRADLSSYLTRLELASYSNSSNRCTLFVTLTYSNACIPRVRFIADSSPLVRFSSFDGELLDTQFYSNHEKKQLQKLSTYYSSRFPNYFNHGELPVLNFPDVQGFLKRLRSRLYRKYKERVCLRYALCGEYGENYGRPHYHLLLFFEKQSHRCYVRKCIDEIWLFGHSYSKYFTGTNASYLASYCVGQNSLCPLFSRGSFRARFLHSCRLGEDFIRQKPTLFRQFQSGLASPKSSVIDGKDASIYIPLSLQSTFFPLCRGFRFCDYRLLVSRYLFTLRYSCQKASQICERIFDEIRTYRDCPFGQQVKPYYLQIFGDACLADDDNYVKGLIYRDVLVSRKFIAAARASRLPFKDYLFRLVSYYFSKDMLRDADYLERCETLDKQGVDSVVSRSWFFRNQSRSSYYKKIGSCYESVQSTESFKSYSQYTILRTLDYSKIKKIKEPRTLCAY